MSFSRLSSAFFGVALTRMVPYRRHCLLFVMVLRHQLVVLTDHLQLNLSHLPTGAATIRQSMSLTFNIAVDRFILFVIVKCKLSSLLIVSLFLLMKMNMRHWFDLCKNNH